VVRQEVIRKRLDKLDEYLKILENIQRYSKKEFVDEPERYGSAERFLQLAIETINDMASHIVAEEKLGVVDASRDLPRLFRENNVIDENLGNRWIRIIGFRNILVHDYLDVDRNTVYSVLQNEISDLKELMRMFSKYL